MNKHKLILPVTILIAAFVVSGFFYASQIKKMNFEQNLKENNFLLKEKCFKYAEPIAKKYGEANRGQLGSNDGILINYSIVETFYSTNLNTCLTVETEEFQNYINKISRTTYYLTNILSKEIILQKSSNDGYSMEKFNEEIKVYR